MESNESLEDKSKHELSSEHTKEDLKAALRKEVSRRN